MPLCSGGFEPELQVGALSEKDRLWPEGLMRPISKAELRLFRVGSKQRG